MTPADAVIAVATSGGRDSTALLHAVARQCMGQPVEVLALHVHHGLMPQADAWVDHLSRQVRRWAKAGMPVRLAVTHLQGQPAKGESVEAWARAERYAALARMATAAGASHVLLAHHQRDQAETVVLQALRGAGPAGLAAMPAEVFRNGVWWCRPWLEQPSSAIDAYVRRWQLSHISDPSNDDHRFDRNRLRHGVLPPLLAAFPQAEPSLAAVARQAHWAAQLQQEAGEAALSAIGAGTELPLPAWHALPSATRRAALLTWLHRQLASGVSEALVQRLMVEAQPGRAGRWPVPGGAEVRAYRGQLSAASAAVPNTAGDEPDWHQPGTHTSPNWGGQLTVCLSDTGAISLQDWQRSTLVDRQGGEQFQLQPRSTARALKKQYQAMGVPAWQRQTPLWLLDGVTLFVPGLGVDGRYQAAASGPRVHLEWRSSHDS